MLKKISLLLFVLINIHTQTWAQQQPAFKVIPLGVKGGDDESNLSAYMLASGNSNNYICLDAGTIKAGIQKAIDKKSLKGSSEQIQRANIKGYLISHAHLDHVAGLIINSPADTAKYIYGLPSVLDIIKTKYFSWDTWANFGNEGEAPQLKKYSYTYLTPKQTYPLTGTDMSVQPFELSHVNPYKSTAFLVEANNNYVLYLGDTGADELEKANNLENLWQAVAPLINKNELKAIFLEVSFPNEQANSQLFGHLTPKLFYQELNKLKQYCNADAFKKLTFIVTHIKPPAENSKKIKAQLKLGNTEKLNLAFPEQGETLTIN